MVININHNHVNNKRLHAILKQIQILMAKFTDVEDKLTALDLSVDQLIAQAGTTGATEQQLDTLVSNIDATQKKVDDALATKQV